MGSLRDQEAVGEGLGADAGFTIRDAGVEGLKGEPTRHLVAYKGFGMPG